MSKKRYLTKSRFKLAVECPTKLYYTGKDDIYANRKLDDPLLLALADGGHQVGELAKYYYPGGHDIVTLDKEDAIKQTNELLKNDNVVIYEAAIKVDNFFIRTDILVKKGNYIKLIEVKSKSICKSAQGSLKDSKWKPYLYDVAFQKYVLSKAFGEFDVSAYLMVADKESYCPTDSLNQKFKLIKDKNGRKQVIVSSALTKEDLSEKILIELNVNDYCEKIYKETFLIEGKDLSFADQIECFANYYIRDEKIPCKPSTKCSKCEFRATEIDEKNGLRCGFSECWIKSFGLSKQEIKKPLVLNLWQSRKINVFINKNKIKLNDLLKDDLFSGSKKINSFIGLSTIERQWLQIEKVKNNDSSPYVDKNGLKKEMDKWIYPFHFIDFETARVAIPFNKGMSPYDGIAFQFSHHIVYGNGRVEHKGEYINLSPGQFPNYEFIRELKKQLEVDDGTIFRYGDHENSFLNTIYYQLKRDSSDIKDRSDLSDFIKSISKSIKNGVDEWCGDRKMVDMCDLVRKYYYDPATNGSNSLKHVLPALLNSSKYLQKKYSKPIYGAIGDMQSLNYKDQVWVKFNEEEKVIDPYKLLPKLFSDLSSEDYEKLVSGLDELNNGGVALTAYAKMQTSEVMDFERVTIKKALLKYCELDTLAMVMLYEGWQDLIGG